MWKKRVIASLLSIVFCLNLLSGISFVNAFTVSANDTGGYMTEVYLEPGESTDLWVTVDPSTEGCTYSWKRTWYDIDWKSHEESLACDSYMISVTEPEKNYLYSCYVTSPEGNWGYSCFYIFVQNDLHINDVYINGTSGIYNYTADYNKTVIISVDADAVVTDDLSYRWYRSRNFANDNGTLMEGEIGTQLEILVTEAYEYRCDVYDKYGNHVQEVFDIDVNNNLVAYDLGCMDSYVEIDLYPNAGTTMNVIYKADDMDSISVNWSYGRGSVTDYYDGWKLASNYVANITSATIICTITDRYMNTAQVIYNIRFNHLEVTAGETRSHFENITLPPGTSRTLSVNVTGDDLDGLRYYWSRGEYDADNDLYSEYESFWDYEDSLPVENIIGPATYRCRILDKFFSEDSAYFMINTDNHFTASVSGKPGVASDTVYVCYGGEVNLTVDAYADNPSEISYRWVEKREFVNGEWVDINETLDEVSSSLHITDVRSKTEYRCIIQDGFGSSTEVFFSVCIENDFYANASGKGFDHDDVFVKYGESTVLTVDVTAISLDGLHFSWESDDTILENQEEFLHVYDVTSIQFYACTVSDKYGNSKRVSFTVYPDFSDSIYAGDENGNPIDGINDCYYALAYLGYNGPFFYVTPLKTVAEASQQCETELSSNPVYIWMRFITQNEIDPDDFENCFDDDGIIAIEPPVIDTVNSEFLIGVKLWNNKDADTCYFSGKSRADIFEFANGPAYYGGLTLSYFGAGDARYNHYGDIMVSGRNLPYGEYFNCDYDDSTSILTITPLISYSDFLRETGKPDGSLVAFELVLSLDVTLFNNGAALDNWEDIFKRNGSISSGEAGEGDIGVQVLEVIVRAWAENDIKFCASGTDSEGNVYTQFIRLVTLDGPPSVESVVSPVEITCQNIDPEDIGLVNQIIEANSSDESLGIADELKESAFSELSDTVEELINNMSQVDVDLIDTIEIQSHLEVSITGLSTDTDEPSITLEINPVYEIVQKNKDDETIVLDSGTFEVNQEVDIVLYVGDIFGSATDVIILHYKDGEDTPYQYFGMIDNDNYLIFRNPHGFSSFEIKPTVLPSFKSHSLVLSGQIGVNFFVDLTMLSEPERESVTMEFTVNGKKTSDVYDSGFTDVNKGDYHGFTCYVNSVQMADEIIAELHYMYNNTSNNVRQVYKVSDYIDYVLSNSDDFTYDTVELVKAMADYGHYIQPFLAANNGWELGTDHAVMNAVNVFSQYESDGIANIVQDKAIKKDPGDSQIEKVTYALNLESETEIWLYLKVKPGYSGTVTAAIGNNSIDCIKQKDGRYLIVIGGISAHEIGDQYEINVSAEGEFTITVSALSYVNTILTSDSAVFKNDIARCAAVSLYNFYNWSRIIHNSI